MVFGIQLRMNSNNCERLLFKINKFLSFIFRPPSLFHTHIHNGTRIDLEPSFILIIHSQDKSPKCTSNRIYF